MQGDSVFYKPKEVHRWLLPTFKGHKLLKELSGEVS